MSIVLQATKEGPKRWRLSLDCGHEAYVIVGHRPALGGRFTCETCASKKT